LAGGGGRNRLEWVELRHGSVKRVASAAGEGAIAIQVVHQYLADDRRPVTPR
jgi:hypothetical protein